MNVDKKQPAAESLARADSKIESSQLGWIYWMIACFIIIGAFCCAALFILRRKQYNSIKDNNKKAIVLFGRIEKIVTVSYHLETRGDRLEDLKEEEVIKGTDFDSTDYSACMEHIRKARFGRGKLSKMELGCDRKILSGSL